MKKWTILPLSVVAMAGFTMAPIVPASAQVATSVVCPQSTVVQNVAELLQAHPDAGDEYVAQLVQLFSDCPDQSAAILNGVLAAGNADQIRAVGRAAALSAIELAGENPEGAGSIEENVEEADSELLKEAFREASQTGQIGGTGNALPIIAPLTTGQTNDDPSPIIIRG